jgi:hypothetical protein
MQKHAIPLSPKSILYLLTLLFFGTIDLYIIGGNTFDSICMVHDGINKKSAPAKIKYNSSLYPINVL